MGVDMKEQQFKYFTLIASIVLLVFSTVYYMERVIMYDTSYYFIELFRNKTFCIQHHRYGAAITQIFPLFFISLQLPWKWIAIAYSINTSLLFVFSSMLAGYTLKNWKVASAIILCPFLFNTQEFFWMVSESQFTPAIWLFIFAFIQNQIGKSICGRTVLLLFFLLFVGLTIHPLSVFCFFGLILFLILLKQYTTPIFLATLVLFFVAYGITRMVNEASIHDNEAMEHVRNIQTLFPHYFFLPTNMLFLSMLGNRFLMIPVLFLLVSVSFFLQKRHKTAFCFTGLVFGYILFVNVCFYDIEEVNKIYLENVYQPIVFFLFVPLLYAPKMIGNRIMMISFVVILLFGAARIVRMSDHYTARLNWERNFIAHHTTRKIVLPAQFVPMDLLEQSWCVPFEFAILSSIERPFSISHYFSYDPQSIPNYKKRSTNTILGDFEPIPYFDLPKHYFHFPDSVSKYLLVPPRN